jgi:hypothetical protein
MPTNVLEKRPTVERPADPPPIVLPRWRPVDLYRSVNLATTDELALLVRPAPRRAALAPLGAFGKASIATMMLVVFVNAVLQLAAALTANPVFSPYPGESLESIRFVMTGGREQVAAVPGALLLNWQEGQQSTLRLTLGNPTAEPVVEQAAEGGDGVASIRYPAAWPGVDAVIKATPNGLAYDLLVQPGADPSVIDLAYVGATELVIEAGRLRARTPDGSRLSGLPESWQDGPNGRENVTSDFELRGDGHFGFTVGPYDPSRVLLIDPPDAPSN